MLYECGTSALQNQRQARGVMEPSGLNRWLRVFLSGRLVPGRSGVLQSLGSSRQGHPFPYMIALCCSFL